MNNGHGENGGWAFSVKALTVGYHGEPLIRDISFDLPRGSILTLIGPNGAGKSTILKTVAGQLSAIAGTVMIGKEPMDRLSRKEQAERLSVLLTERVNPDMMTCFEVAAMGRYPYTGRFGKLTEEDREIGRRTLAKVHTEEIAEKEFACVSDGQRQRVLLARALCQEPEILVLDEPTSFLDIRHKIDLLETLLEVSREEKVTVLLSMHEIDLAEKISDLVMGVKGETVWKYGRPEELFRDEVIAELYDLERGSYLTGRGSLELAKPEGEGRVFVIGGGGRGIPHYRRLQKKGIPFFAGILYEHDREAEVACALARATVLVPAFEEAGDEQVQAARQLIRRCGTVLDAGTPAGPLNRRNTELLAFAEEQGIRIVRDEDELD